MNWKKISLLLLIMGNTMLFGGCQKQDAENVSTVVDLPLSPQEQYEIELLQESASSLPADTAADAASQESSTDAQNNAAVSADNTAKDTQPVSKPSASGHEPASDSAQTLLQNPGTLASIANSVENQSTAELDLDGDGNTEKIILEPSKDPNNAQFFQEDDPLAHYHLQVGSAEFEGFGRNIENNIWAVSLDGKNILLVLYENGPSDDPYTCLFQYQDGKIIETGGFADDIRQCRISPDGIITGTIRMDVVQTDYVTMSWHLGPTGLLEEIPQDVYDFTSGNWVELLETLPLHTALKSTETFDAAPQKVKFRKTSSDASWVLIETESGQQGWMHLDHFNVAELQKSVYEVFNGLNIYD
ncbi:MAG: hypothetical protein K2N95_06715 [Lachnospiraceae bacterium]|nr:hypothetical protein [Lachnospiraceae bacterium]